ncbi:hypothetical protein NRS6167_21320 [Bacillus subtilis]|nr:hypothetical protein NRS6167_00741 [Bacillus subtilis]CAI6326128.1 hypothetical protein NRS6167_21320 [Bacillus subtilis]
MLPGSDASHCHHKFLKVSASQYRSESIEEAKSFKEK